MLRPVFGPVRAPIGSGLAWVAHLDGVKVCAKRGKRRKG